MVGYRKSHCFKISWNCWGVTPKLWNLGWMGFWDGTGVCQETCRLPTSHYAHSLMDASSPSQGAVCSSMRCKALLSILTCGDLVVLCMLVCKVMLCHAIQDYVVLSTICAMYCPMLSIIHCARHCSVVPSTLCPMRSLHVLWIMRFTLCALYYALCAMYYTLCPMLSRAMY